MTPCYTQNPQVPPIPKPLSARPGVVRRGSPKRCAPLPWLGAGAGRVPGRAVAGWVGRLCVLLATSRLCRAWKALGAELLGMPGWAGLSEASEPELSLEGKGKSPVRAGAAQGRQGQLWQGAGTAPNSQG